MQIGDSCIGCGGCVPYCPMAAIGQHEDGKAYINQDECVECGGCLNSKVCPVGAFHQLKLEWPRILKAMWSSVVFVHHETKVQGRGTEEMKTNDVTNRFKLGEVGFGVELGRPSTGARFKNAESVTIALAHLGVEFEAMNPFTKYIDTDTSRFLDSWRGYPLDEDFKKTKVMTFIIEFKTGQENVLDIIRTLDEVAKEINTVLSVDLMTKCTENGEIPVMDILDKAGVEYYINGKTNVGLGHPRR